MQGILVVVYEERGRVVLEIEGRRVPLSVEEAREIARALAEAADRSVPLEPAYNLTG